MIIVAQILLKSSIKLKNVILRDWGLFLILMVSAVSRVVSAFVAVGESGGDFYNYLLMTKSFLEGGSIFIEKRLPVYALLLIPGHLLGHSLGWARFLGIVLALLTLYFLYQLLQDLRLPKIVTLTSLILLSFQPTFFLFSIRPLSHILFNFELIFCLFLFYRLTRGFIVASNFSKLLFWQFVFFGLVLGATGMTRHEGFLVAGVLLFCLATFMFRNAINNCELSPIKVVICYLLSVTLSFGFVVLPWFMSNSQRFGSPFYTEYQIDTGLNVAYTFEKLLRNFLAMRDIFLGMWGDLGFVSMKEPWLMLIRATSISEIITVLTMILMFIGLWVFIRRLRWAALPIITIFVTQFAFLTVVQPWPRHSQHLFFLSATLLALGLFSLISLLDPRFRGDDRGEKGGNAVSIGVLTLLLLTPVWVYLAGEDQAALGGYVRGGQKTLPLLRAVETLQRQFPEGAVLVSEKFKTDWSNEYSLIHYYLGSRITYNLSDNSKYILDYNGTIVTR